MSKPLVPVVPTRTSDEIPEVGSPTTMNASNNTSKASGNSVCVMTTRVDSKRMVHKARVEHKLPGRIRIKIQTAVNNPEVFKIFTTAFSLIPGITKVTPNFDTGSIVIHYDYKHEAEFQHHFKDLCSQHAITIGSDLPGDEISVLANRLEAEADYLAEESELLKATVDFVKYVNNLLKVLTDSRIDLKVVVGAGLAVFTFVKIGAEASTPMWVTLTLFAANHMIELKHETLKSAVPYADLSTSF